MSKIASVRSLWVRAALAVILIGVLCPVWAQKVKDAKQNLDNLAFTRPQLRVSETLTEAESLTDRIENVSYMDSFRSEYGTAWHFLMDERTGRVNVVNGGAIPFIPGPANDLKWGDFAEASCLSPWCLPRAKVEGLARDFLAKHQGIFKVPQDELVLDPVGSVPIGDSIYLLRFQWVYGGVPVDGGSIFFIINNGNLIQVGLTKFGDIKLDPTPTISKESAWEILASYVGGIGESDQAINPGELVIMPITPRGMDADMFSAPFGTMIDYVLVYKIAFHRPGVMGNWEALVDAHTGEIIRFRDANEYGHVQGGVYKTDAPQTEVSSPFPYVDYGASAWCDSAGNFTGTTGTSTMNGRTGSTGNVGGVYITDATCGGTISLAANASGLIDFGASTGTDCTTPGVGGNSNTHAARTQYWNVTEIKMKAYTYLPTNTWLQGHLQDEVNENQTCNAYWDGTKLNFFHKGTGSCANTGELPGVSLHEWGHGMDANDGSGGTSPPIECRADWTALLQTHQSCAGAGFLSGNCAGYGDACTACTGVRDADWNKHTHPTAWTPQNNGQSNPGYSCASGSYNGPCGWEDHCESGIASQALWDFANRDLEAAPTNLDSTSAWVLADRLYYTGMPTMGNMYTCSGTPKVSNGCGTGMLYLIMKAMDDDGDGVANGTPHAAAIFAALNRHGIGCGASGDATNQNETSCPTLTTPTLSGANGNNSNSLSWTTGGANATRYFVFRNETSCTTGFTRIATVTAPTLIYTDSACYNGVTYYYRVQAATAKDQCTSVLSNCINLTPQPCTTPGTPTIGTATVPGNNQITVSWTAGTPAGATYNVYRSTGACPGGTYSQVKTGQAASPWTDATVSGGTTYSYEVTAVDSTGGCESLKSGCASATATGTCTMAPTFAGLTSVTNPGLANCTLNLSWSAGTSNCSGSVNYKIYRNAGSAPVPPAGLIASGVSGTTYSDSATLTSGTTYYYIVHAVDSVNGSEDTNAAAKTGVPTGPVTTSSWTDTFEGALSGGGFDLAGWTHNYINGTTNWAWSTAQKHDGTHSWFAADIASVSDMVLVTPAFGVGSSPATTLSFWHTYAMESTYDGGTIEYTTNGGTTWTMLPVADYTAGAPSVVISSSYSNPIGGETAWSGGTVGTMTQVTANLGGDASLVGKTIQLRWHEGNDSSVASTGWYVDTVVVTNAQIAGTCTTVTPGPPRVPYSVTPTKITTATQGTNMTFNWDVSNCASTNYHILYGQGANIATLATASPTVTGSACTIGTSGTYTWNSAPSPASGAYLWFLIIGDNGSTTEGSWGQTSGGAEEGLTTASSQCTCTVKNTSASCGTP